MHVFEVIITVLVLVTVSEREPTTDIVQVSDTLFNGQTFPDAWYIAYSSLSGSWMVLY